MAIERDTIQSALRQSWAADTSYAPKLWTPDRPAYGQCTPSSLVVHRLLGGKIIYRATQVDEVRERHYLNILPDGNEFDSTREQYPNDQVFTDLPNRLGGFDSLAAKLMNSPSNKSRFMRLNDRVLAVLTQEGLLS